MFMDLRYSSIDKKGFGLNNASDLPFIITYRQGGDMRSKVDGGTTLLDLTNFLRGKNSAALPHYDHAMLFTENDDAYFSTLLISEAYVHLMKIRYDATNGRGYILGTSYLSGICTPMSTSVIVDHGSYNSAGIAAHELGHNLGVIYHDGDYAPVARSCPKELNYIMAPSSAIINNKTKDFSFKFSDCSINQIERQIKKLNRKSRKNCLAEDPGPSFATLIVKPYLAIPPGQMEDVHMQCKQIYGDRSFMCVSKLPPASPDEMCYKMYCYHPERKICITASEQRAALGSSCGHKKWCKLGKCVDDLKAPEVPNDCPFPDVPPPRALCKEEASPFRCENDPVFYRRCCQSCNKISMAAYCKSNNKYT
ncbi:hypothetical protein KUTeg_002596 [Tegillarca granosa]|uniref:Peptidase M12B domain-containing protein n=1 Tax=Tegillarca granosa TaxID=220873 RepID=A0ABQ9FUS7_TEGGR|nr:hypothetical protein KUTeg_002596 [Tegillarca granosa]